MKKQKKQLIALAAVLVFVIAGYLVARFLIVDEDLVQVENVSEEVFHMDKATVAEVCYTVDVVTVEFIKDGDKWALKNNRGIELDQVAVNDIVGFAAYLNSKSVIDEYDNLADYGLDNPRFTVRVKDNAGNEKCYYIGDRYVVGSEYFAKVEGEDAIYTIAETYPNAFVTDIEQFTVIDDDKSK